MNAIKFLEHPPCLFTVSNLKIPRRQLKDALAKARGDALKTAAILGVDVSDVQNNRRRYRLLNDWQGPAARAFIRKCLPKRFTQNDGN